MYCIHLPILYAYNIFVVYYCIIKRKSHQRNLCKRQEPRLWICIYTHLLTLNETYSISYRDNIDTKYIRIDIFYEILTILSLYFCIFFLIFLKKSHIFLLIHLNTNIKSILRYKFNWIWYYNKSIIWKLLHTIYMYIILYLEVQ